MAKTGFDGLMLIGVDIGKDTFHLVGFDHSGQRLLRKQIKRLALVATFERLPHCIVGMEALPERTLCEPDIARDGL